jgi:ERCC4-type nuclease
MIAIDTRTGSKELAPLFRPYGIPIEVRKLDFGDLAFEGNGPRGRCMIAVERKTITELVQSIESRRLSGHQLPGMADAYDYCYLVIEGMWRPGTQGELIVGHGTLDHGRTFGGTWSPGYGQGIGYRAVDNYLATMELHAGVIFRRTLTPIETVAITVDLFHWWNDKPWEKHSAHLGVYAPAVALTGRSRLNLVRREIPLREKWAMQIDGIDMVIAERAAARFESAWALAAGTAADWQEIRGIGRPTAQRIVRDINASL